jgi:hypothetical protein
MPLLQLEMYVHTYTAIMNVCPQGKGTGKFAPVLN